MAVRPVLQQTVLDTPDPRALAEFYRQLLGLVYRAGDAPPPPGQDDQLGRDWLVLEEAGGRPLLAFQASRDLAEATWPDGPRPQQLHLDLRLTSREDLDEACRHAVELGARLLRDESEDPEEPLRVYADLAGHPFCLYVGPD